LWFSSEFRTKEKMPMKSPLVMTTILFHGMLLLSCGGGNSDGGGGTCGAFSACGGDLTGTWIVNALCMEGNLAAAADAATGLPAACDGTIQSVSIKVNGTIQFANFIETSNLTVMTSARFQYTAACLAAEIGTSVVVTQTVCDLFAASLKSGLDSATCTLTGGNCDCNGTLVQVVAESKAYTLSGSTLTYASGKSVQFCVSGNNLTVRSADELGMYGQYSGHR